MSRRPGSRGRGPRGLGSVYQRATDRRWVATYVDALGRGRSVYAATQAEAIKRRDGKLRLAIGDRPDAAAGMTVADYVDWWLAFMDGKLRPRTAESYASNVARVKRFVGHLKVGGLGPLLLSEAYREMERSGGRNGKPISARTVVHGHRVLHRALEQGVELEILSRNPANGVVLPEVKPFEAVPLTPDEVARLLGATENDPLGPLWQLLVFTGLRLGEALALKWTRVDLDRRRLQVVEQVQLLKGGEFWVGPPKSRSSRRGLALGENAMDALQRQKAAVAAMRLAAGPRWAESGLVFPSDIGGYQPAYRVSASLARGLKAAGVQHRRVHDLRHTTASLLFLKEVHPKKVQTFLGHSTIAITIDTYTHLLPGMDDEMAGLMDEAVRAGRHGHLRGADGQVIGE